MREANDRCRDRRRAACAAGVAVGVLGVLAGPAHAQRGSGFVEQDAAPPGPQSGFPGLFDTEVAGRGDLVTDFPWLSVEYGVTENLTVGTNLWAAVPLIAGAPSAMMSARYRHHSSARVSSALTGFAGYSRADALAEEGDRARAFVLFATSSTSFRIGPDGRHTVTATVLGGRFGARVEDEERPGLYDGGSLTGLGVAGSYQFAVNDWLGIQATLLGLPVLIGQMDSTSLVTSIDLGSSSVADRVLARLLFQFRPAPSWFLTAGAVGMASRPVPVPWASVARRW